LDVAFAPSDPSGKKCVSKELRELIFRIVAENKTWGAPRIHGELKMLGFDVSERTVLRWMRKAPRSPEPARRWEAFLCNHREAIAAMDFFTVPTFTFGVLYCFFVIAHDRRRVMQFNVTKHPSSAWVIQQLREAFPYDSAPDYLILDRGPQFNYEVIETVKSFGIRPKRTSFRSPWQNGVAERWVGSCRRDLLDHVIVVNERHLKRLMNEYVHYYHEDRTHLALAKGTPAGRETGMRPVDGCKPVSIQDSVVCIIATTWSPELSLRPILNGSENSRRETCAYQPRILCFVRFSLRSSGTEQLHSGR
jgi:putative transposase